MHTRNAVPPQAVAVSASPSPARLSVKARGILCFRQPLHLRCGGQKLVKVLTGKARPLSSRKMLEISQYPKSVEPTFQASSEAYFQTLAPYKHSLHANGEKSAPASSPTSPCGRRPFFRLRTLINALASGSREGVCSTHGETFLHSPRTCTMVTFARLHHHGQEVTTVLCKT